MQKAGNNGTEKLLSILYRVSCTNYLMSIEIIRCSVRWIETTKPDTKTICGKITLYLFNMTQQCAVAWLQRETNNGCFDAAMQTSRAYEFMGVNPPSFPSIPQHENAALVTTKPVAIVKVHSIKQPHRARRQVVVRAMTQRVTRHLVSCRLSFRPREPSQQSHRAGVIFL